MERLVQLLKGDEGSETNDGDTALSKAEENNEDDDEDYKIEEV